MKRVGRAAAGRAIYSDRRLPYLLLAPAALYLLLFQGAPLLHELWLSLTRTSLLDLGNSRFVGLSNYAELTTDRTFLGSLRVTVVYVAACVVGTVGLGLGAALVLNRPFPGRPVARALLIVPWAAPPVAVALIATWMFNAQYGIINRALGAVGLAPGSGQWLDNPSLAMAAILATTIWQLFPFTSVVLLAALQSVPDELREAAVIDGARAWMQFRVVVWPVIGATVGLLALLMTIWSIRRFELIWLMTQGGPVGSTNTLVIGLYRRGFILNEIGKAAAIGMVGLAFSLAITIGYFILTERAARAARSA